MMLADLLRYTVVALAGAGLGMICVITAVAYHVLRPPQRLGFLVQHIIAIGIGVGGAMILLAEAVVGRLGQDVTWRLPATLAVLAIIDVALVVVYRIERRRLIEKRALARVGT